MKVLTLDGEELSRKGGIVIEWGLLPTQLWLIFVKYAFVPIVGLSLEVVEFWQPTNHSNIGAASVCSSVRSVQNLLE